MHTRAAAAQRCSTPTAPTRWFGRSITLPQADFISATYEMAHDNTPAGQFRQRLDNNVKKMVDNFSGLIKTARIDDKPQYSREAFQTSVHATSLVS
jgi:hypothetical protein